MKSGKSIFKLLKKLKNGERCVLHISSNSMQPLIHVDHQVSVEKISIKKIKKFDVIAFYSKELKKIVVHRVVNVTRKNNQIMLTTKGDNNNQKDEAFVKKSNFLGKITTINNSKIKLNLFYLLYKSRLISHF